MKFKTIITITTPVEKELQNMIKFALSDEGSLEVARKRELDTLEELGVDIENATVDFELIEEEEDSK